jgi:SAM-dependent methyltransferase
MANSEMVELWNGPDSEAWVETPERYDAMLEPLGVLALDAAALRAGESVLDVGCGSGQLTLQAAERVGPTGRVVGADVSGPLVARARQRGADAGNVAFVEADAQVHDFGGPAFDAIVSRFGVMFFDDPATAFRNLRSAGNPSGRLAFVAWQAAPLNEWVMTPIGALVPHLGMPELPPPGSPGPFAFADADHVRSVLTAAGWRDVQVEGVETTVLVGGPGSAEDVVEFYQRDLFGRLMLAKAPEDKRLAALADLREAVGAGMSEDGLRQRAAVWVVTARC